MYNRFLKYVFLPMAILAVVWACRPASAVFDTVPQISLKSVNTTTVRTNIPSDSLRITINFQDGDGDLGTFTGDSTKNLVIIDTRAGYPDTITKTPVLLVNQRDYLSTSFRDISNNNRTRSIVGTISHGITAINLRVIDPLASSEQAVFQLVLVDRSGNRSNVVETPPITIRRN